MKQQNNLYWCDHCSITTIDSEGVIGSGFFGCYNVQKWVSHLKTAKHTKQLDLIKSLPAEEGVVCDECSKTFTIDGYATHKNRNKHLWECSTKTREITQMTCNNFCVGKKRYESVEAYKASLNPPKQRRTPVGKFSPITQTIRPPNGYRKEKPKDLIVCNSCNGALFTSQYDTKFLNLHNTFVCKCEDDIKEKQETKYEKDDDDAAASSDAASDASADADGVDITQKPQLDDICYNCSLPVNYDVPIKIIKKWEIDICECFSEDESE